MFVNPKNFKHVKSQKIREETKTEDYESTEVLQDWFISGLKCDNCNEKKDLVYDQIHGEIICNKCGHVIIDHFHY
ncbi:MAG: hypothetical protein E7Z73_07795 [Methanobrevibacter millerae]|uniref:TFIIB-type domain-containing protein n=1 Tax=Methanobrevibacter millerae TaxID=230361 RepID=A0A8T3VK32_9EURY|nr:TFIIB-type zinc ribbon-containing protein [Methanobrevibacter millerae]MBE6505623.1 hypothetical protein [Methanobrevibacter millerae]